MRKRSFKALSLALLSACMLAGASITAGAVPENLFSCSTSRDAENDILVDFKEMRYAYGSTDLIPVAMVTVGIGEILAVGVLGSVLIRALERYKHMIFRGVSAA